MRTFLLVLLLANAAFAGDSPYTNVDTFRKYKAAVNPTPAPATLPIESKTLPDGTVIRFRTIYLPNGLPVRQIIEIVPPAKRSVS